MDISPPLQVHPVGHFSFVGDHHTHLLGIPMEWELQTLSRFTTRCPGGEGSSARREPSQAEPHPGQGGSFAQQLHPRVNK